jgi:hypothetical protein
MQGGFEPWDGREPCESAVCQQGGGRIVTVAG